MFVLPLEGLRGIGSKSPPRITAHYVKSIRRPLMPSHGPGGVTATKDNNGTLIRQMYANITILAEDFTQHGFSGEVVMYPVFDYSTEGSNIIVGDRLKSGITTGYALFTGVVSGYYRLDFIGPYRTTSVPIYVNQTGSLNAKDLITASTGASASQTAYTQAQSDSRFVHITGSEVISGDKRLYWNGGALQLGPLAGFGGGTTGIGLYYAPTDELIFRTNAEALSIPNKLIIENAQPGLVFIGAGDSSLTQGDLSTVHIARLTGVTGAVQTQLTDKVSKGGNETISGTKTFANDVAINGNLTGANIGLANLYNLSNSIILGAGSRILLDSATGTSLDWQGRTLSGNWNAQGLAVSGTPVMLSSGSRPYVVAGTGTGTFTVNFSGNPNQQLNISVSGSYTFTGSNVPPSGFVSDVYVYIKNTATGACALTFPGAWTNLGAGWPTGLLAGKSAMLWVRAIDTGTTLGSFNVQL
jgi:hypothetical protein